MSNDLSSEELEVIRIEMIEGTIRALNEKGLDVYDMNIAVYDYFDRYEATYSRILVDRIARRLPKIFFGGKDNCENDVDFKLHSCISNPLPRYNIKSIDLVDNTPTLQDYDCGREMPYGMSACDIWQYDATLADSITSEYRSLHCDWDKLSDSEKKQYEKKCDDNDEFSQAIGERINGHGPMKVITDSCGCSYVITRTRE